MHGAESGDGEVPDEIARRESRLETIRAAKAWLGARQRAADDAKGRKPGHDRNPKGGRPHKRPYGEPDAKEQDNFTDPEIRIMKTGSEGFQQCFNAQVAVDGESQMIVATEVGQEAGARANSGRCWAVSRRTPSGDAADGRTDGRSGRQGALCSAEVDGGGAARLDQGGVGLPPLRRPGPREGEGRVGPGVPGAECEAHGGGPGGLNPVGVAAFDPGMRPRSTNRGKSGVLNVENLSGVRRFRGVRRSGVTRSNSKSYCGTSSKAVLSLPVRLPLLRPRSRSLPCRK